MDHWLYFIRTGETKQMREQQPHEIRVSSMKGVLVELEVPSPNDSTPHSLADSGFGYSQLLPILARGLMASRKHTVIVEQPELHLNPGVQIRLAEFFVSLVLAGKQVLLETHSEHMVNAVRVLVAEQDNSNLTGRCNIFYIRASGDGHKFSHYRSAPTVRSPNGRTSFSVKRLTWQVVCSELRRSFGKCPRARNNRHATTLVRLPLCP